mgnify:CR=1 FL=1
MPKSEAYLMDCMDYMRTIPDKWIDLAVVDPPYGIDINKAGWIKQKKQKNSTRIKQALHT